MGYGYVHGVADAPNASGSICLPQGVVIGQEAVEVMKYVDVNPEKWQYPAEDEVYLALYDVWPCDKMQRAGSKNKTFQ